jgi:hypothetical protein
MIAGHPRQANFRAASFPHNVRPADQQERALIAYSPASIAIQVVPRHN